MSDGVAPLIYIIVGEPSGDLIGAKVMAGLREAARGNIRFAGIGGPRMAEQGLTSLVPISELAVMGLVEVLPHARRILRHIRRTVADIEARRPAIVVTIDSSSFNWRVARRLREAGDNVKLVHVVAPMVWAWRAHRAKEIARWYNRLLVLLPFEPPYFERFGLATTFIGHPVVESGADRGDGPAFRLGHNIGADVPVLSVLPGSRRGEVHRLLPSFGVAVAVLRRHYPNLCVVIPTLPHVAPEVRAARWQIAPIVIDTEGEKYGAFAASNVALAASGTVALELAMAHVPSVIAYRINALTHAVVRRMVKVKYANLVNLLLDRAAVPELIQADCTPERLAGAVAHLLDDPEARAEQMAAYDAALTMLGRGGEAPSRRAAREILEML